MNTKISDEEYNKNWQALLAEFKSINHKAKGSVEKYTALKEKARGINPLTAPQLSGIVDRCNNVINGTYNFGDHNYKPNEYDQKRSENKK